MTIAQEDHIPLGLKRIGHQYAHSEKYRQFVTATLQPLNNLEAAFLSLLDLDLDTADGVVLDLLGRIVGAPAVITGVSTLPAFGFEGQENALSFGEDDPLIGGFWDQGEQSQTYLTLAQYRTVIKAQILKNHSGCTPNEIIQVINTITNMPFAYIDGTMWIGVGLGAEPISALNKRLIELFVPRPSGVQLRFVQNWIGGFGWSDQPDAQGWGEEDPNVGGFWAVEL